MAPSDRKQVLQLFFAMYEQRLNDLKTEKNERIASKEKTIPMDILQITGFEREFG